MPKCDACGVCCGALELGPLQPGEEKSLNIYKRHGKYYIKRVDQSWAPWAPDGVCVYLNPEMKCSIHDTKPKMCRKWYCTSPKVANSSE